jgi:hypothetical protein
MVNKITKVKKAIAGINRVGNVARVLGEIAKTLAYWIQVYLTLHLAHVL